MILEILGAAGLAVVSYACVDILLNRETYMSNAIEFTYKSAVRHAGLTIIDERTVGDWQGDLVLLVESDRGRGILVIGYGSCSGCDFMEAIYGNVAEFISFAESLPSDVDYRPLAEIEQNRKDGTRWYYFDGEVMQAIRELLA